MTIRNRPRPLETGGCLPRPAADWPRRKEGNFLTRAPRTPPGKRGVTVAAGKPPPKASTSGRNRPEPAGTGQKRPEVDEIGRRPARPYVARSLLRRSVKPRFFSGFLHPSPASWCMLFPSDGAQNGHHGRKIAILDEFSPPISAGAAATKSRHIHRGVLPIERLIFHTA